MRLAAEVVVNPVGGRLHGNADAVVLAEEDDGRIAPAAHGVARGVDAGQRRGVVGRGVAKGAQHDGVRLEAVGHPEAVGPAQRVGQAVGLGQVRGNGARLRWNPQRLAAPDLVPAAGNGVISRSTKRTDSVQNPVTSRGETRARHHQPAGPIVQEARVVDAQQGADDGVLLVSGARDGVEGLVGLAQFPRRHIQQPAGDLVLEDVEGRARR